MTLQAKQQRHERDLYELKIKAEREALETQLQLEENRQRVARVQPHTKSLLISLLSLTIYSKCVFGDDRFSLYLPAFQIEGTSALIFLSF